MRRKRPQYTRPGIHRDQKCDSSAENLTLGVWLTTWVEEKPRPVPSTKRRYWRSLCWLIEPHPISKLCLMDLSPDLIKTWIQDMYAHAGQDDGQHILDVRSIRNTFSIIRAALNTAVQRNLIHTNPCDDIELPTLNSQDIQTQTTTQELTACTQVVDGDCRRVSDEKARSQERGVPHHTIPIAQSCDFSQIDFAEPEIRRSLINAYHVLLKYRIRLQSAQAHET